MIRVQREPFDAGAELNAIAAGRRDVGACVAFTGLVRDVGEAGRLRGLTLEHYPSMTEKELARIEADARARWSLAEVLIVHRFGALAPGDPIVLVLVAASHRDNAFDAARFLIDYLKTRAPFWKSELGESGETWVEARPGDDVAADRWRE